MKFRDDDDYVYSKEYTKQAILEARLQETDDYQHALNSIKKVIKFTKRGGKFPIKSNEEVLENAINKAYQKGYAINIPEEQINFDIASATKGMTKDRKRNTIKSKSKRKIVKKCKCKK